MEIRREDIEPKTLEKLMSEMAASCTKPVPSPEEQRARQLNQERIYEPAKRRAQRALGGGLFAGLAASLAFMVFPLGRDWAFISFALGGVVTIAVCIGFNFREVRRQQQGVGEENRVHSDVLTAWVPLLDLTPAERAYSETLALLAETSANLGETVQRDMLTQLNTLMTQHRHLDEQRDAVLRVAGVEMRDSLEAEQARLARLRAETGDAQAQEMLQASLDLCRSRLANAHALTQTRERLDAQQELLLQTFASIQDSLTRNKTASVPLSLPDVEEIQNSVRDINLRTVAVETAVQEVLTLQNRT